MNGVFPGRSQSLRHQRRPLDDSSPGRGGMAQDGETRGGTFHGEIDRFRESHGWTTACSRMPEHDGKDQKERIAQNKRARAGSLATVYEPQVARTCILQADVVLSFSDVTFVLLCFFTTATFFLSVSSFFYFFGDVAFFLYCLVPLPFALCMESTSYVFPVRMAFFYLATTGWIFDISLCENSINQSINAFMKADAGGKTSHIR